jgi:hypothetical protein
MSVTPSDVLAAQATATNVPRAAIDAFAFARLATAMVAAGVLALPAGAPAIAISAMASGISRDSIHLL